MIGRLSCLTSQKEACVLALQVIETTLISSIEDFTATMKEIGEFFTGLKNEINQFIIAKEEAERKAGSVNEQAPRLWLTKTKAHFILMQKSAGRIHCGIREAFQVFNEFEVQIQCIPR